MHTIEHALSATSTESLGVLAVCIGLVVRILKSKTMGAWLDGLPPERVKAIPRAWLPWIAVLLGAVVMVADAYSHGSIHTWREAADAMIAGLLAGSGAVAGNETLARAMTPAVVPAKEEPKSEEKPS